MVRISDILKRGRSGEEEPRKGKSRKLEAKKQKISSIPPEEVRKEKISQEPISEKIREKTIPKSEAKEVRKKEEPSAAPVEIARIVMEKAKTDRPNPEEIYQELITLIKDILTKGTRNEPIEGEKIITRIARLVDIISLVDEELTGLSFKFTSGNYIYGHSVNVCLLSIKMGLGLNYSKAKLNELGVSSFLHDIGMIRIMDIVQQARKLTNEEYDMVKKHPIYGGEILEKARDLPKAVIYVAQQHHERVNGTGYPKGLNGDEINEYARIIGLVDVYEALTHPRSYRKQFLPYEATKKIFEDKALFEPQLLKILIEQFGIYPTGSWVMLNTEETGKVVKVNEGFPLRPTVNVMFGSDKRKLDEVRSIDLTKHPTLYIKQPLEDNKLESMLGGS